MIKKIYYEPAGRIHSAQRELIDHPPEQYEFIVDKGKGGLSNNDFLFFKAQRFIGWFFPLNLTKAWLEHFFKKTPEDDVKLIYSYNHPVFRKKPWVVHVEWAHVLVGRNIKHFTMYKNLVERCLASKDCKGIFTWSELAKQSILLNYDCKKFEHKIEVIRQAVSKKDFIKDYYTKNNIKLLFIGSINSPDTFEYKGGKEVLETFASLYDRFPQLELIIRANVPEHIKERYRDFERIKLYEGNFSAEFIDNLFKEADIFLYPTHQFHNTVILDAMSYGLPVVTIDCGPAKEYIENNKTGFLVECSEKVPYYKEKNRLILTQHTSKYKALFDAIKLGDPLVVERLTNATSLLIEKPELRQALGRAAQYEVEEGKFSIRSRNEKLKRIFDEAIGFSSD